MAARRFVTGASRGLGLELVTQLPKRGDNVTATTRSTRRLAAALRRHRHVAAAGPRGRPRRRANEERFGGLDVVVNNAGYGFLAAVEEVTLAKAHLATLAGDLESARALAVTTDAEG